MNETQYLPLPVEYEKSGFRYSLIKREGMIAIYHKTAFKGTYHPCNFDAGFEVGKISQNESYEIAGNKIEAKEGWPSAELFGQTAFAYSNLYAAQCKFNELIGKKNVPIANDETPAVNEEPKVSKFVNTTFVFPAKFSVKDFAETNHIEYITASLFVKEKLAIGAVKQTGEERRAPKGPMTKIYEKV